MKILTGEQIREADHITIEKGLFTAVQLMERAGKGCFDWLNDNLKYAGRYAIVCGTGNNGGDGLVIARLLNLADKDVHLFIVGEKEKCNDVFLNNLNKVWDKARFIKSADEITGNFDVVIDAIFGTGLNKPVDGLYAEVINTLNKMEAVKVAIDIPSGLYADDNSDNHGTIFKADFTLTFELPKMAFFFAENWIYFGDFFIIPIGLDADYIANAPSQNHFVVEEEIRALIVPRPRFSHKGSYGHSLLIGGSKGKIGAMLLGAKASLRVGAGLTTVHLPNCGYAVLQTAVPEAMCSTDVEEDLVSDIPKLDNYNAIGIGPGLGTGEAQAQVVNKLLKMTSTPLVIDADALNILAENPTWMHFLPAESILTPHPGEFDRLADLPKGSTALDRYKKQREISAKCNCFIVLKGSYSSISCPDGSVFFNSTGNPGMATGGSGDVLTGMITGLMAQRYKPKLAAILGVYLHGLAGDLAAADLSEQALSAGDIVEYLPKAFKYLGQ